MTNKRNRCFRECNTDKRKDDAIMQSGKLVPRVSPLPAPWSERRETLDGPSHVSDLLGICNPNKGSPALPFSCCFKPVRKDLI